MLRPRSPRAAQTTRPRIGGRTSSRNNVSAMIPSNLAAVAVEINDRPRRIHHWKKLSEVFTELINQHASTA